MTKKELAIVEELKIKCALSWPQFEKPTPIDVVAEYATGSGPNVKESISRHYGSGYAKYVVGFTYSQSRVITAWYDGAYGTGAPCQGCVGGRIPIPIFETMLEAIQYKRWELSEECAKQLLWMDETMETM